MRRLRGLGLGRRLILALAVGGAVFGIATVVQAAIPDAKGVIHSCYKNTGGSLRLIDPSTGATCNTSESPILWNQIGPTGAKGMTGARGPTGRGATGPSGTSGLAGQHCDAGSSMTGFDTAGKITCSCPTWIFAFVMNSSTGTSGTDAAWPGGSVTATYPGRPDCSVTVTQPSGDITLVGGLGGDPWQWSRAGQGYSTITATPLAPSSCPPLGIATLSDNRPSCSTGLNGSATADLDVTAIP